MQNHWKSTHYDFQIRKCKDEACNLCSIFQPICLSPDIFDSLSFLPDPLLDETKDHSQSFEKLFRTKTTEKDQPSLKFGLEVSEIDKANKELFLAQKVCNIIKCSTCKKPRCIYSNGKLNHRDIILIQRVKDENIYMSGSSLFPPGHEQVTTIVVKRSLSCEILPMETTYCSTKNTTYPLVCFHCRGNQSSICNNTIRDLKQQYQSVCPICTCIFQMVNYLQLEDRRMSRLKRKKQTKTLMFCCLRLYFY